MKFMQVPPQPFILKSLAFVRAKIYGNELSAAQLQEIVSDIANKHYSAIQTCAFITACATAKLNHDEIFHLSEAMVNVGNKISWDKKIIVDKHCVGGLPANRTTPIIVPIVAAFGLTMPKTSSRAITSPSGSADVIEVFTNANLSVAQIKEVVTKENACLAWGGSSSLSPADDIMIHIERELNLDSEGQMVASILSKKIAAGSNHILIDIPIGKTVKVRNPETAHILKHHLEIVAAKLGIKIKIIFTDGSQPIGRGIGPALEASDIIAVLTNEKNAPQDLRKHALILAGEILEFSQNVKIGEGKIIAEQILSSGKAWQKFLAICEAQGGIKKIPQAKYVHHYLAHKNGTVEEINNRHIAITAKLAGAPIEKAAGIYLNAKIGDSIKQNDILFSIHANSTESLQYALDYANDSADIIKIA